MQHSVHQFYTNAEYLSFDTKSSFLIRQLHFLPPNMINSSHSSFDSTYSNAKWDGFMQFNEDINSSGTTESKLDTTHDEKLGDKNKYSPFLKKTSSTKNKIKTTRFAFETQSRVDILDDGYKWRKYGQKVVKNNKFPRSYYRCTHQGCNVKKQVQRLSTDEGIVVTTYEGLHQHPVQKHDDNFEQILTQMHIYPPR